MVGAGDGGAGEGQDWHPGRVWLGAGRESWAACGWGDPADVAVLGESLLVGSAMSQEASAIGATLAGVGFGVWQGGAARAASTGLQEARAHATLAQAFLVRAEEAMRHQSSALRALVLASVGVP